MPLPILASPPILAAQSHSSSVDMVRAFDVDHVEVRQVDDAAILAHGEMLGIRDAPEVAVVPLVLAHRHAVAVFLQQVLVGGVAMRALPAAEFHEIAAEFLLALVERRALDVAAGGVGFARMDRRVVDLLRRLAAAALDELFGQLVRIEARIVDAWRGRSRCGRRSSSRRPACRMPGPSLTQMATAYHRPRTFWLSPIDGPPSAVTCSRPLKERPLVVAEFAEDRRQFDGALQRLDDLLHVEVALRGRQARLVLFEQVARMAQARVLLLVVAPLDLPPSAVVGSPVSRM